MGLNLPFLKFVENSLSLRVSRTLDYGTSSNPPSFPLQMVDELATRIAKVSHLSKFMSIPFGLHLTRTSDHMRLILNFCESLPLDGGISPAYFVARYELACSSQFGSNFPDDVFEHFPGSVPPTPMDDPMNHGLQMQPFEGDPYADVDAFNNTRVLASPSPGAGPSPSPGSIANSMERFRSPLDAFGSAVDAGPGSDAGEGLGNFFQTFRQAEETLDQHCVLWKEGVVHDKPSWTRVVDMVRESCEPLLAKTNFCLHVAAVLAESGRADLGFSSLDKLCKMFGGAGGEGRLCIVRQEGVRQYVYALGGSRAVGKK